MKRLAALALVLLVCLAFVGVGYARWFEVLTVNGTVQTGELNWEFFNWSSSDVKALNSIDQIEPDFDLILPPGPMLAPGDKNVGSVDVTFSDADGDGDKDIANVVFDNVYPQYFAWVVLDAHNNGSVPLHVDRVRIAHGMPGTFGYSGPPSPALVDEWWTGNETEQPYRELDLSVPPDGVNDIAVIWEDSFGDQLHPISGSPGSKAAFTFKIVVLQGAPQGEALTFPIEIEGVQWNESIHPYP